MTVSQKSSSDSKGEHGKTLVAGMDVPFASPRPGGFVKIQKGDCWQPLASTSKPADDDFEPTCTCKNPACQDPCKRPTVTIHSPENSVALMKSFALTGTETTRDFRIHKAMTSEWDVASLGDLAESEEDDVGFEQDKPPINLLAVLISTVMLLAAGSAVPKEVLCAAESYLRCIKDDYDNTPPNVQGLLNYICLLKGQKGGDAPAAAPAAAPATAEPPKAEGVKE